MKKSKCRTFLRALLWASVAAPSVGLAGAGAGVWQQIEPSGPVYGPDGTAYVASCSGYPGTDPTFRFWARMGATDRTVVYFEGGGACWDDLTCSFPYGGPQPPAPAEPFPQLYVPTLPPAGFHPSTFDGLFRTDRADNPVRDWNIVYIPYCTGDIHTGSATRTYANNNPLLPLASFTVQHRGFDNFMTVLDWLKRQRRPKQILVTGVSAGGYGATANFPWVKEAFEEAHVSLLADASQGVTTPEFDNAPHGRRSWNPQLAPWVFGDAPVALAGTQLMRAVARAYPQSKVAQFTTARDAVQVLFYGIQKQQAQAPGACPYSAASDWNRQMLAALTADAAELPNYRYYLADGTYHTLLSDPPFYDERTRNVAFSAWLGQMLKNQGGTNGVGGRWFNIACPDCLAPLPCPPP